MTQREYCESQGFQFVRVAGGMFDLRRDGSETVKHADLGRATDNEEGWAVAETAVRNYVAAETAVAAAQQEEDAADAEERDAGPESELAGLLADAPDMDGRLPTPPMTAIMGEVADTGDKAGENVPARRRGTRRPEPEPDQGDETDA